MESMQTPALLNRHERRRHRALARQRARQARRRQAALPAVLLASATIGILATADLKDAQAQVVLNPPGTIPGQCAVTGGTAVCEGNLSAGLDADGPPLSTLTVQNLTSAITPAAGVQGIDFDVTGNGNATLNVNTAPFGITTVDRNGIDVDISGDGTVTIVSTANINSGFDGIDSRVAGNGDVIIRSDGTISAVQNAIDVRADGTTSGSVWVTSNGAITTVNGDAIDADAERGNITIVSNAQIIAGGGGEGIDTTVNTDGNIDIRSTAGITTTGNAGRGIYAGVRQNGSVTVHSTGPITTQDSDSEGIYGRVVGNGNITLITEGAVTTRGDFAEGVAAEHDGNGNIVIRTSGPIVTRGDYSDAIEGEIATGDGNITVIATGPITTYGSSAEGVIADVGFGNGNVTITTYGAINTFSTYAEGVQGEVNVNGNVTITTHGTITTRSDFSDGIEAELQSFGAASGDITVTANAAVRTKGANAEAIEADHNGNGTITITANAPVSTQGDSSEGLYASLFASGNIVVVSKESVSTGGDNAEGIEAIIGAAGSITVTAMANVIASGASSDGILANAAGSNTVNLINSTVQGGSGDGIGVSFAGAGGSTNTLNTYGNVTLSSLGGTAVNGGAGNTTINNFGTLNTVTNGAIELGGGTNAFNNNGGAIFNAGGIVNLGAGNLFSNSGTLSPGASEALQTTAITGNLVQNGGGIFLATVDPTAGTGDLVTVTGTANLSGIVQAEAINPVTGMRSVTILSAAGGTTNNGLGLLASPALQASLSFPNANDVVLNYSIDFSAGGLNPNQTALANGLNAAANAGARDLDPVFLPLLNNVFTIGDYRNALNQLLPEVMLNTETATLFSAEGFVDNLFSCRLAGQNHTALSEGECYWARPQGRFLDRDSDANTIGFDETAGGLAAGAQVAVAPNWFAGFALGYERASLDTDTGAETDSNRFSGGLSLKYQAGSFLLGAAISGGVSGNDTQRPISIGGVGGFNATAESNYAIKTLTGQARAAYVFQFRDWFAKPLVDVTATYLSRDSLTESGAGAANLALAGSDDTFFSVTPALEIGGDFALSETSVIRPYVRAGVSFYTDSDHGLTASFVNAPAGTSAFSITSDFDDVFADVAAGATAFFDNGSSLGLAYEGLISSDTQQHGISVKGTWRF